MHKTTKEKGVDVLLRKFKIGRDTYTHFHKKMVLQCPCEILFGVNLIKYISLHIRLKNIIIITIFSWQNIIIKGNSLKEPLCLILGELQSRSNGHLLCDVRNLSFYTHRCNCSLHIELSKVSKYKSKEDNYYCLG